MPDLGYQGSGYIDPATGEWVPTTPGTSLGSMGGPGAPTELPGAAPATPAGQQIPSYQGPANSPIPSNKQVGPWTNEAQDAITAAGGGGGIGSLWNLINPLGRLGIAAGGVMHTTPAETGELPRYPAGLGAYPPSSSYSPGPGGAPSPVPGRRPIGSDANYPLMGAGGFPTAYAAPGQQPAGLGSPGSPGGGSIASGPMDPSIIARGKMRTPAAAPANAPPAGVGMNPRFVTIDRPNAPAGGSARGGGGGLQMGALNLGGWFNHPAVAAAAAQAQAAPPNGGTYNQPGQTLQQPGAQDPEIAARQKIALGIGP